MSVNMNDPAQLNGTTVIGGDGQKLGSVDAVYYDNATDRAEWVAVRSGLLGTRVTLVPLRRADHTGDELRVPFDKVQLRNAPHHDPGNELSPAEEADLYRYYGIDHPGTTSHAARSWGDDAMTRSEEHLRVGTTADEVGRARLRKHVVNEHQQVTVPVSQEEVRVEREPILESALRGTDITEAEHEVVLRAERPVVDTVAEPVERVRLAKETVTEQRTVEGDVRQERIEYDGVRGGHRDDELDTAEHDLRDHRG